MIEIRYRTLNAAIMKKAEIHSNGPANPCGQHMVCKEPCEIHNDSHHGGGDTWDREVHVAVGGFDEGSADRDE